MNQVAISKCCEVERKFHDGQQGLAPSLCVIGVVRVEGRYLDCVNYLKH